VSIHLATRMLALMCAAAEPGDPWTEEAFAVADASIRLDAARALVHAGDPLAAVAVHDVLVACVRDAVALLGTPAEEEAKALVREIEQELAADSRGAAAIESVAARLLDDHEPLDLEHVR
jgi:hypothetical protein